MNLCQDAAVEVLIIIAVVVILEAVVVFLEVVVASLEEDVTIIPHYCLYYYFFVDKYL